MSERELEQARADLAEEFEELYRQRSQATLALQALPQAQSRIRELQQALGDLLETNDALKRKLRKAEGQRLVAQRKAKRLERDFDAFVRGDLEVDPPLIS